MEDEQQQPDQQPEPTAEAVNAALASIDSAANQVQHPAPQPLARLFAVYRSLWMGPEDQPALALVLDLIAEQGHGAVHGFLVPDGSYFNEQTAEIDGKVSAGERVWKRGPGWRRADQHGIVAW